MAVVGDLNAPGLRSDFQHDARSSGIQSIFYHRLPLQPQTGSCLLDKDLQPMGTDLALFWALWDNAVVCNAHDDISEALSNARINHHRQNHGATGPMADGKADLDAPFSQTFPVRI
ncbi:MAG: hypothetical protein F6K42_28400 [Leptolyngbya sp. SIO1D8]|nr:hypothetical protein [Leptolyngbya sp. SIO1D8]